MSVAAAGLPIMQNDTHIVPVFVGDPERCKHASDLLLERHAIYIQPINYPTVTKGTERLRITPSPYHDDALIDDLADALVDVWKELGLPINRLALATEERMRRRRSLPCPARVDGSPSFDAISMKFMHSA